MLIRTYKFGTDTDINFYRYQFGYGYGSVTVTDTDTDLPTDLGPEDGGREAGLMEPLAAAAARRTLPHRTREPLLGLSFSLLPLLNCRQWVECFRSQKCGSEYARI
jgi:hypothetical protein